VPVSRVRRLIGRLRGEQSGFTLIELLVGCTIGTIVLMATFMMLDSSVVLTGKVTDRVDRTQRARLAMETITRELRSQVCPAAGVPAIVDGTQYSVKFYYFTGTRPFVPDMREIAWDTNTNSIVERVWTGTGASPNTTWPSTPSYTRTLIADVKPPPSNAPMFEFYSVAATSPFAVPLVAPNQAATSRIRIKFLTYSANRNTTGASMVLQSEVLSRTVDPNGVVTGPNPECA
jgi:prepilin-type N-terminal cleavage/methylation domain-containing protein